MTTRLCSVAGCDQKHFARGFCRNHYERWKRNGDPVVLQRPGGSCSVEDCGRPHWAKGLCRPHYKRFRRYGNALADPKTEVAKQRAVRSGANATERFWGKVDRTGDCWLWLGAIKKGGYGQFWFDGRGHIAHRWIYISTFGVIPAEWQIDHLCNTRNCVNPAHLRAITPKENNARSTSPSALNAKKTHCLRGHPLVGGNVYIDRIGRRSCKTCQREANKRYLARRSQRQHSE